MNFDRVAEAEPGWQVVFGYRDVSDVAGFPQCPCKDTGYYAMLERRPFGRYHGAPGRPAGFEYRFVCWCGRRMTVEFANDEERDKLIESRHVTR